MADLVYEFNVASGQFGRKATAAIGFQIDSRVLDGQLRQQRGRFGGPLMKSFAGVHGEMARTVLDSIQETLVERMSANTRGGFGGTDRPRGSTSMRRDKGAGSPIPKTNQERLSATIIAQENLRYDSFRFSAFIQEWMDSSPAAPYWRFVNSGGPNPSAFLTFSSGGGPRKSNAGIVPEAFRGYRYVDDGLKRGLAQVRGRITDEYRQAGASVGVRITVGAR